MERLQVVSMNRNGLHPEQLTAAVGPKGIFQGEGKGAKGKGGLIEGQFRTGRRQRTSDSCISIFKVRSEPLQYLVKPQQLKGTEDDIVKQSCVGQQQGLSEVAIDTIPGT